MYVFLFQVARLVIIHEEGEAGHEMPDLERPVVAVSKAVTNLVKVRGRRKNYIRRFLERNEGLPTLSLFRHPTLFACNIRPLTPGVCVFRGGRIVSQITAHVSQEQKKSVLEGEREKRMRSRGSIDIPDHGAGRSETERRGNRRCSSKKGRSSKQLSTVD